MAANEHRRKLRSHLPLYLASCGLVIGLLPVPAYADPAPADIALVNRLTWGVDEASAKAVEDAGPSRFVEQQLRAQASNLPPQAQAQIDAMRISRESMAQLVVEIDAQNNAIKAITDPVQKKAARDAYNKALYDLNREAQSRSLLRDLYGPDQLREQMTWFWFNHFNVQSNKRDIRAMVGDYEDQALRAHALGRFRDLLEATLRHPAMLRYLDNDQNALGKINENYAREIMELHTMGVGSGYTQKDVQELARILTGVGVDLKPTAPKLKPQWQSLYLRSGLFEFNPARHDFGDKQFLGHTIHGSGFGEVEQALDLIAASPATAHHVSLQLATYFVGDAPPAALVDRMAATFKSSHGDIAAVLRTLFRSPEFKASLGKTLKDPIHYAVSAVRLAYNGRTILNTDPLSNWLQRMGQGLFAHETPDGYAMASSDWSGPGQMATRFDIARSIGSGSAGLFKSRDGATPEQPAFPQIQSALFFQSLQPQLSASTVQVLAKATSPQEWNTLYLSSPEFMRR